MKKGFFLTPILIILLIVITVSYYLNQNKLNSFVVKGISYLDILQKNEFNDYKNNISNFENNVSYILSYVSKTGNVDKAISMFNTFSLLNDGNISILNMKLFYPVEDFVNINNTFTIDNLDINNCNEAKSKLSNYLNSYSKDGYILNYSNFRCEQYYLVFKVYIIKGFLSNLYPYYLNNGNYYVINF